MCYILLLSMSLFGTVFLDGGNWTTYNFTGKVNNQSHILVRVTAKPLPGISNTSRTLKFHPNSSIALTHHVSTPTTLTTKNASVTWPTTLSPHHNKTKSYITTSRNYPNSTIPLITPTMSSTTLQSTAAEIIIGSRWDGWKKLLTKNYWKNRINDTYYLMDLLIPMATGLVLCVGLVMVFCSVRCLISLRNRRKKKSQKNYNSEKINDNTWMLLENSDSEEDVI